MGSTNAQVFINTGAVRFTSNQYYHDRNITIIPANTLTDSALVRFYFLDSEVEALLNATGCPSCSKPSSAYRLGVSKYTEPANRSNEDGTLANNLLGTWTFISSPNAVKVPFDKGYYAEFKVKDFSEFWLNNGGFSGLIPLPLQLISFNAYKQSNDDVLLEWRTEDESNIDRYEIEVAKGSQQYQTDHFVKIGQVSARNNSSTSQDYNFTDAENNKAGVRYYRLKIVESNGSFRYSAIRPVVFSNEITWQIYPNPSSGIFNFVFQQNAGEIVRIKVYNIKGQVVQESEAIATGFVQKMLIDLQQSKFAPGMYMIVAEGESARSFKVVKQ
jgi:hypothetical protein